MASEEFRIDPELIADRVEPPWREMTPKKYQEVDIMIVSC
jgi:hypothetical protein